MYNADKQLVFGYCKLISFLKLFVRELLNSSSSRATMQSSGKLAVTFFYSFLKKLHKSLYEKLSRYSDSSYVNLKELEPTTFRLSSTSRYDRGFRF